MWNFAHYKHCDVLDKFKQMFQMISAFSMVNGKKKKEMENIVLKI